MSIRNYLKNLLVSNETDTIVDSMPKPVGSFGYDPWGYNTDMAKIALSVLRPFFEKYFRVETFGLENIPATGRVLLIANHSGQLPIDGCLVAYAVANNKYAPRAVRIMVERWIPTLPFVGNVFNEMGAVIGDPENCAKMLQREEAIVVFPEGVRGSGKTWDKRYKLQRFGLGFMHLAITEQTPIIPIGIVGCEETMPTPFHIKSISKLFGMPYFPVTTPVPFPAKVRLYFGEPIVFDGPISNEDEIAIKVERVKEEINKLIAQGLQARKGWFE